VFRNDEIKCIKIDYNPLLSVKAVLNLISDSKEVLKYLPDHATTVVTREYLFPLLHTYDTSFFTRA
jgi:hypothetical protein